jgi:hypothetical protein
MPKHDAFVRQGVDERDVFENESWAGCQLSRVLDDDASPAQHEAAHIGCSQPQWNRANELSSPMPENRRELSVVIAGHESIARIAF